MERNSFLRAEVMFSEAISPHVAYTCIPFSPSREARFMAVSGSVRKESSKTPIGNWNIFFHSSLALFYLGYSCEVKQESCRKLVRFCTRRYVDEFL